MRQIHWDGQDRTTATGQKLCPEEQAKRKKDPFQMWEEMQANAAAGTFPKGTDVLLYKYHGLFHVAPAQDAFMCRLRFHGRLTNSHQFRGLADVAEQYAGGYADVTTRANLQLREIKAGNPLHVITSMLDLGIITRGSGGIMAAMAQLNCGACGYLCQTYSEAIAQGTEKDLTKCTPGGTDTAKTLKRLIQLEIESPSPIAKTPITSSPSANGHKSTAAAQSTASKDASTYSRNNPFSARLVSSSQLTHPESPKDTRHVVIDLLDSGLQYEPGDSLGILPQNDHDLVSAVIARKNGRRNHDAGDWQADIAAACTHLRVHADTQPS